MKRTITSGAFLVIGAVLFGSCGTYKRHANIQTRYLPKDTIIKLNATGPVAVKNISSAVHGDENTLCGFSTIEITGSLYDFTEATIGIVKEALQRNSITIDDKADKKLELSVVKVDCGRDWDFFWGITLRVKTGNGLDKVYTDVQKTSAGYAKAHAFELAMGKCVEQMLKDKDIVGYLEQ